MQINYNILSNRVTKSDKIEAITVYAQRFKIFNPERSKEYAPPMHTIFYRLWKSRKLTTIQCIAANMIYEDAQKAFGQSKGLVSSYSERVDVSNHGGVGHNTLAFENSAQTRLRELVNQLHAHERNMLIMTVAEFDKNEKVNIDLKVFGSVISGFNGADQARAAGTSAIQRFLDSVAEFYNIKESNAHLF